jgi:hypothetical protein
LPKLLSRGAYQIVALAMLVVVYGIAADLAWRDWIPFRALASTVGVVFAGLLVLVVATFAWVLAVLPLRLISDAPAIVPPPGTDLASALAKARADLEKTRAGTPAERRGYHVRMMLAGIALGLACTVGVAANLELSPDRIWVTPIVLVIGCALLVPYHALRALLTR